MLDGHPPTATPAVGLHLQPDLDPGRHGADAIISYITQAITASNQPAHCGRALIRRSVRKFCARAAGRRHAYLAFTSGYLVPDTDRHDRASTLSCLGTVALERFADARAAGEGEPVLLEHLNAALRSYQQSLELTPADDHQARGAREHQLGIVYSRAGDTSQALRHYQRSSR